MTTIRPLPAGDSSRPSRPPRVRRLPAPLAAVLNDLRDGRGSPFALLRRRLVVTNVVVVGVVLLGLCALFYTYEARITQTQVDQQLVSEARHEAERGLPVAATPDSAESPYVPGSPSVFSIIVAPPHRILQDDDQVARDGLPDWDSARPVLAGTQSAASATIVRDGIRYRVYTIPIRSGNAIAAVQSGTSLRIYDDHLRDLLVILLLLSACVLLLTTTLSIALAARALNPARQAFARQRQFAAAAAHELRTPLAFIRSQAELIAGTASAGADEADGSSAASDALDIIGEVDYLTRMTRDLLLLARDERDTRVLNRTLVDLRAVVRDVAATALPLAQRRGVRLEFDRHDTGSAGEHALWVSADADRLRQLVVILLDNGIHYTPAGGSVRVETRAERKSYLGGQHGDRAVLAVHDTGVGIAPDEVPHIFEPFYRASAPQPQARDDGGTGLGLALAQWIAHAHDGTIAVRSTPGQGSVFTVSLPLAPAHLAGNA